MGDQLTIDVLQRLLDDQTNKIKTGIEESLEKVERSAQNNKIKVEKLEKRCIYLERKLRKNNIIIFGLPLSESSIVEQIIKKLNELFSLQINISDLNNVYKIGKGTVPPIVVEFVSYLKKIEIFNQPDKLKNLKGTGISISNDMCQEDRVIQKTLRKHLKKAREENKQARIKGEKLEIENVWYSVKDLEASDSEYYSETETQNDSESENEVLITNETTQKQSKNRTRRVIGKTTHETEKDRKEKTPPFTNTRRLRHKKRRE